MALLNQLLAVSKSVRSDSQKTLTDAHHVMAKAPLFAGLIKTYTPASEDGEQLPGEAVKLQARADLIVHDVKAKLAAMYDVMADIDATNQVASADVEVDGTVLLRNVPVTHLLWLEKQLQDLYTVVRSIPTLDPSTDWTPHDVGVYAATPVRTLRAKKIPRNHVKAKATDKHAEQVEVYFEDTNVGTWETKRFSGAMRPADITILTERVGRVHAAVKKARETANMTSAVGFKSSPVLDYIFQ